MEQTRTIRRDGEEGYVLIAVIFMLAVLMIGLLAVAAVVKTAIERDREQETLHRGKQYIRAVRLYYRQFGRYPSSMDQLVETNKVRFLRQKYLDPATGKDDWKAIAPGQNKVPAAYGFFGKPMPGLSTGFGSGLGGGGLGANPLNASPTQSNFGSTATTATTPTSTDSNAASQTGATTTTAAATDPSQTTSSTGLSGQTNPTFGGVGIMGVSPASAKPTIYSYKKKTKFNEWEFTYDPAMEQMLQGGNLGTIGTPAGGTNTSSGISTTGTSSFGTGGTSTAGTTTTTQQ